MKCESVMARAKKASEGRGWLNKLTVSQTKEFEMVRVAYHKLEPSQRPTLESLRSVLSEELGFKIARGSFSSWLTEQPSSLNVPSTKNKLSNKSTRTKGKSGGKG
jgi:hypothetical protein